MTGHEQQACVLGTCLDDLVRSTEYSLSARGLMHLEGRVMLALGAHDRLWRLPGGRVRRAETPGDAVRRSIRSLTGLSVRVGDFIGLVHNSCDHLLELTFEVRPVEGCEVCLDEERILHALWFRSDGLPVNVCEGCRNTIAAFMEGRPMPFLLTHRGGDGPVWHS